MENKLIVDGVWETAEFTVPAGTPEERVRFAADKYRRKFGDHLEKLGFTVKYMTFPEPNNLMEAMGEHDRKRYLIRALVTRRPVSYQVRVPDNVVDEFKKMGLKEGG